MERFGIARFFNTDPGVLRHLPRSEYRKRRAYWLAVNKAREEAANQSQGWEPEPGSTVIGE